MPTLPIINNRAGLPLLAYPRSTPAEFGAVAFEELGHARDALQKINDSINQGDVFLVGFTILKLS